MNRQITDRKEVSGHLANPLTMTTAFSNKAFGQHLTFAQIINLFVPIYLLGLCCAKVIFKLFYYELFFFWLYSIAKTHQNFLIKIEKIKSNSQDPVYEKIKEFLACVIFPFTWMKQYFLLYFECRPIYLWPCNNKVAKYQNDI